MQSGKKAMMHSIEGVIATLLLLSFFVSIDVTPQKYDWGEVKSLESIKDITMIMTETSLKTLIDENRGDTLKGILNYFISPTARITIKTHGVPKQKIFVGILMNDSELIVRTTLNMPACPSEITPAPTSCVNGTIDGSIRFVALKLSGNFVHDRIYLDINKDGLYDSDEGPISSSNLFTISGNPYLIRSLISSGGDVNLTLWNVSKIFPYYQAYKTTELNSKEVSLLFNGMDLSEKTEHYKKFDAILIPEYRNFTTAEGEKLKSILNFGISIIEIANLTNRVDSIQENIFGIKSAPYTITFGSNTVLFNEDLMANDKLYKLSKYTTYSEILYYNFSSDMTGYDFSSEIDAITYKKIKNMTLNSKNYAILVAKNGSGYNLAYFDTDSNQKFEDQDNESYQVGQFVEIDSNKYYIASIDSYNGDIKLSMDENHTFEGVGLPSNVYSLTDSNKEFIAYYKDRSYKNNSKSIESKFDFLTDPSFMNPTLPLGGHKNATLNVNGDDYSIVATNKSGNYSIWNIDLNSDGNYDGVNEGPFYTTSKIAIGPEIYMIFVSGNGNKITVKLVDRWKVPYAIGRNFGKNSKTVWIEDDVKGDDFWNLIRGAIIWASSKEDTLSSSYRGGDGVISIKKTMIKDEEYLEFGELELLISG
ncbi:MAG: hypothetical protein KAS12_02430 [Candidatus Aenigmarchaeota archaeon]|nr:hypothetical protein [Candidatus Aenigmarchaeota archaeon]